MGWKMWNTNLASPQFNIIKVCVKKTVQADRTQSLGHLVKRTSTAVVSHSSWVVYEYHTTKAVRLYQHIHHYI